MWGRGLGGGGFVVEGTTRSRKDGERGGRERLKGEENEGPRVSGEVEERGEGGCEGRGEGLGRDT